MSTESNLMELAKKVTQCLKQNKEKQNKIASKRDKTHFLGTITINIKGVVKERGGGKEVNERDARYVTVYFD